MKTRLWPQVLSAGLVSFLGFPGFLDAQSDFYRGKTIRIVHGRDAGGSGDLRVKALVPFLQKYIPGNPTIVNEFMPGGGGRKAANYIYGSAAPDGLTIGNAGGGMVSSAVLGETGVQYDIDKFVYLGSPYSSTHYFFLTRKQVGLGNLEKLRSVPGVRVGAQSVGHTIYNMGRLFAWLVALKDPKFITGYSTPERDAAFMGGELDAFATTDDHLARNAEWISANKIDLHVLMEVPKGNKYPGFDQLPEIETFAASERERKVLAMFRNLRLTGSPFFASPRIPAPRIDILKNAMTKSLSDPDFYKEYKKLLSEAPTPLSPEENQRAIRELPRDSETIALFNKLAGAGLLPAR
jgi:tripartite-type tricarboxylate transporter receptor subunit TctC